MPTKNLLTRFRGIKHSGKHLNMKLPSKPIPDGSRDLPAK
jgi:hypothetical protein